MKYGDFKSWIHDNCSFARSSAYNYIKLYNSVAKIPEVVQPVGQLDDDSKVEVIEEAKN